MSSVSTLRLEASVVDDLEPRDLGGARIDEQCGHDGGATGTTLPPGERLVSGLLALIGRAAKLLRPHAPMPEATITTSVGSGANARYDRGESGGGWLRRQPVHERCTAAEAAAKAVVAWTAARDGVRCCCR